MRRFALELESAHFVENWLVPFGMLGVALIAVAMFWRNNPACLFLIMILLLIAGRIYCNTSFHYISATNAFVYGTILEHICVERVNAWNYTNPTFIGLPMWLPMGWPLIMLLVGRNVIFYNTYVRRNKLEVLTIIVSVPVFLAYLGTLIFYRIHFGICVFYVVVAFLLFIFLSHRTISAKAEACIVFFVSALYGSLGELTLIYMGVWKYEKSLLTLVILGEKVDFPLSLAYAWGISGVLIFIFTGMTELVIENWGKVGFAGNVWMAFVDTYHGITISKSGDDLVR